MKIFKRFMTWLGWFKKKSPMIYPLFVMPSIALIIWIAASSLNDPNPSTLGMLETLLFILGLGSIIFLLLIPGIFETAKNNYRMAIANGDEEIEKAKKQNKPEFLVQYVKEFEEIKKRARTSLNPTETNSWISNFKKLWQLKGYLRNLNSSKLKDDKLTMEQRIAAFRAKVIEEALKADNEIKQTEEKIYHLNILLLPG